MPKHLHEQINYYEPNLMLIRLRLSRPDPKQAVTILCCSRSLRDQYPTLGGKYDAASASFSVVNKCIFVRDATLKFYLRKSFGSDFGRISCNQVFRLEDRRGCVSQQPFVKACPANSSLSLFVTWTFARCFGQITMSVRAGRWGFNCPRVTFSEPPTVGSVWENGHFVVPR